MKLYCQFLGKRDHARKLQKPLYNGCNFGAGERGREAEGYLQNSLVIRVSASDDITGKDGDWELEVGEVFVLDGFGFYQGNLQPPAMNVVQAQNVSYRNNPCYVFDRISTSNGGVNSISVASVCKKSTSFSVFDFKDNADASVCTINRAYEDFENKELTFVSDCFKIEYNVVFWSFLAKTR